MGKRPNDRGRKPAGWAKASSRARPPKRGKSAEHLNDRPNARANQRPGDRPSDRPSERPNERPSERSNVRVKPPHRPERHEVHERPIDRADSGQSRRPHPQGSGPRRGARRGAGGPAASPNLIWGYHPVREALRSPRRKINQLYASQAAAARLEPEIAASRLQLAIIEPEELDRMLPAGAVHQGLAARVEPLPDMDISDLPGDGLVLVLDQITDPHNLGAIIRSAAAFAVSAIILTERNAPPLAGIVAKSASGGLEHVPVIQVVNLARAMEELGTMGYWRIGLDSDGEAPIAQARLDRPLALVLGAEGKGMRRLTRENCDMMARLDMPGAIKSLNVSNACAVALTLVSANATAKA